MDGCRLLTMQTLEKCRRFERTADIMSLSHEELDDFNFLYSSQIFANFIIPDIGFERFDTFDHWIKAVHDVCT